MKNGFCFAGMTEDGRWIRPVLPERRQWNTLLYSDNEKIKIGDVIRLEGMYKPETPHTEDMIVKEMVKIGSLSSSDLIAFLNTVAESTRDLEDTIAGKGRSLCLVKASSFKTVYIEEDDLRKTRISFKLPDVESEYVNNTRKPGYPCVCLHWRAIQGQGIRIKTDNFKNIFLGIGLAREFFSSGRRVRPAPMIISIITDPPLPGEIDYNNP